VAEGVTGEAAGPGDLSLRIPLAMAIVGSLLILVAIFGTVVAIVGLGLIVLGTVLSAPAAPARGWWGLLAVGAALSIAGALVSLGMESIGGLLAVAGGVLVLVGASLGFPIGERSQT